MAKKNLGVLQVNTLDNIGGAARIASELFKNLEKNGFRSYFAVGVKQSSETGVIQIPNDKNRGLWERFFTSLSEIFEKIPVLRLSSHTINLVGKPSKLRNYFWGIEEFDFPGTSQITCLVPSFRPDLIHCHNLHGEYFDLRMLPKLSQQVPLVITLHDAWLISGHCAHSFNCERWKIGCGQCPDLSIYQAIHRDSTAYNWKRKQEIFRNSRLYIVSPCQWLMDKVNQSMLKSGIVASKVIPNGVDLKIFHPDNHIDARKELGLPIDTKIILFAAIDLRKNIWKDYRTLQSALVEISNSGMNVLCLALGDNAPTEHFGNVEIRFIPFMNDQKRVARYYQAVDLYVHPSRAETFPTAILEALACGIPVVASAVGGIPEQIVEGKTGYLVPSGDPQFMAKRIIQILSDDNYRQQMGREAVDEATRRFGLDKMMKEYLQVYQEVLGINDLS